MKVLLVRMGSESPGGEVRQVEFLVVRLVSKNPCSEDGQVKALAMKVLETESLLAREVLVG